MWIIAANELSVHRSPAELKARDASKANNALGISHLTNGKVPGFYLRHLEQLLGELLPYLNQLTEAEEL